jgi:hypothetical protein
VVCKTPLLPSPSNNTQPPPQTRNLPPHHTRARPQHTRPTMAVSIHAPIPNRTRHSPNGNSPSLTTDTTIRPNTNINRRPIPHRSRTPPHSLSPDAPPHIHPPRLPLRQVPPSAAPTASKKRTLLVVQLAPRPRRRARDRDRPRRRALAATLGATPAVARDAVGRAGRVCRARIAS